MDKQHAHQLLDQLGPGQFEAVVRLLEVMTDPANVSIADSPIDDEPVSEEEERAVAASKEWLSTTQVFHSRMWSLSWASRWSRFAAIRNVCEADRRLRPGEG